MMSAATTSPGIPAPRLAWLAALVAERLGDQFRLEVLEGRYRLSLPGAPGTVSVALAKDIPHGDPDVSCGHWNPVVEGWRAPLGSPLPAPGGTLLAAPLVDCGEVDWRINYDIFGLVYWMLSRAEEVGRTDLDSHGRFPAVASHADRHGYLDRPIVDEWLDLLRQVIQRRWPHAELKSEAASIRVSHDVDAPSRYGFASLRQLARTMAGDIVKRHDLFGALRAPMLRRRCGNRMPASDPSNTFDWIMDVSERHGMTSAFYFICGRTDPVKDALYDPEHPAIRALMRDIHERGHEIGLHPSYDTYLDPDAITREAERLRRVCSEEGIQQAEWGGRMHFLRWRVGVTLRGWERAGMAYDSTLGYADRPGFRCGTCREFPGFDPVAGVQSKVRVRPLIAMECTVMAPRYMGLGVGEEALAKFLQLRRACEAVHGCFTLLWHNSELESPAKRELYEAVLH